MYLNLAFDLFMYFAERLGLIRKRRKHGQALQCARCYFCGSFAERIRNREFTCRNCGYTIDFVALKPRKQWYSLGIHDSQLFPACRTCNQRMSIHNVEARQIVRKADTLYVVQLVLVCAGARHAVVCYPKQVTKARYEHFQRMEASHGRKMTLLSDAELAIVMRMNYIGIRHDGAHQMDISGLSYDEIQRLRESIPGIINSGGYQRMIVSDDGKTLLYWKNADQQIEDVSMLPSSNC